MPETLIPSNLIAFLPWLRLAKSVQIAGVEFAPFRSEDGALSPVFKNLEETFSMILSTYVDRKGEPVANAVIATIPGRGWRVTDDDLENVGWAARLLFLGCWGANKYYSSGTGRYVSSIPFRPIWQRFTGGHYVALTSRRRCGHSTDGGYKHGEVKFNVPLQVRLDTAPLDESFISALGSANASGTSQTIKRLTTALPFVSLANTDDELMEELAEAILMGSAFEQLLNGDASSYVLGKRLGELFALCRYWFTRHRSHAGTHCEHRVSSR